MDMKEAAALRHTVRKYEDRPIGTDLVEKLNGCIARLNDAYGLAMKLVTDSGGAVWAIMRIVARNAKNFVVLAGDPSGDLGERIGYASAGLMLYARTLGLDNWWIGTTYNSTRVSRHVGGKKVVGIVVVGYGSTKGSPHKSKTPEQVARYEGGEAPVWFREGVRYALMAPTAMNKQAFWLTGKGNTVRIDCSNGSFTGVDTGLVKYHFELGAGKEHFDWI